MEPCAFAPLNNEICLFQNQWHTFTHLSISVSLWTAFYSQIESIIVCVGNHQNDEENENRTFFSSLKQVEEKKNQHKSFEWHLIKCSLLYTKKIWTMFTDDVAISEMSRHYLYLYIYQSKLTLIDWFLFRILLKKIPLWNLLKKNNNNNKRIF